MIISSLICRITAFIWLIICSNAIFYLPGVPPKSFESREQVKLFVNKLTSTKTQIPFDYYHLPYCRPKVHHEAENLGEVLTGDRIENSLYKLEMKVPEVCEKVCMKDLTEKEAKKFRQAIADDYRVHWIVDNLPAAVTVPSADLDGSAYYQRGFPVGFQELDLITGKNVHYLYNHVRITIKYNEEPADLSEDQKSFQGARIVGFLVDPTSIRHTYEGEYSDDTILKTCNEVNHVTGAEMDYESVEGPGEIIFTYDIVWEKSDIKWAHRWDVYLRGHPQDRVHWFSITNSTLIVIFLAAMVAMILVRTLNRDIAQYNDAATVEEAKEEAGWKLVHADVFRPPTFRPMLYAVLVGTGMQLCTMAFILLFCALLGFLSPANRGALLTAFVLLFVFMGMVSGYQSARLYKTFRGQQWRTCTYTTAFLYPGFAFAIFFVINSCLAVEGSTGAVPFSTLFTLLVLWFGISTPLVFLGSYFGYQKDGFTYPVRTNQIPRQIPPQPWYMSTSLSVLVCGILPFGAVSVELFFIMSALWLHQVYYIFGFLFIAMLILAATCVELTMVLTYFQLCAEDYRWWWKAFLASGSCAFYLFLYGIWYFGTQLEIQGLGIMVYFGYMTLIAVSFFIMTGSIGYHGTMWFIIKIYGSIKVD